MKFLAFEFEYFFIRYHTHGGGPVGSGEVSAASRPRQIQECRQRFQGVRARGGHAGSRQGVGAHFHRLFYAGIKSTTKPCIL